MMQNPLGRAGKVSTGRTKAKPTQVLRRLWTYLAAYRWLMVLACVLSVVGNMLTLVTPKLSGEAINAIVPGNVDMPVVVRYVIMMIVLAAISAVTGFMLQKLMITLSRNVVKRMRKDLFDHLTQLPISFFDMHQAGDVISALSYDIDTVGASLSTDLTQIVTSVITVVGSFVMMLTISPMLMLVFLFTIPASILFTRYRSRLVRPLFRERSRRLGALNGYVEETLSGLKTISAYHQEEEFHHRFDEKNEGAVGAYWKSDYVSCMTGPSVNLINNLSLTMISIFGSLMYMAGSISLGGVSSFVLYSRKFSGPINEFANIFNELQSALAAAERVLTLIDLEPEQEDAPDAVKLEKTRGIVSFDHVHFGYSAEKEVLHDICFTTRPGETIAIVGETGCGKTTLINLLMRFYDVTSGSITIDGIDLRHAVRDSLRHQFTMVLQDTWLFEGTVRDNLAYGKPDADEQEIVAAAKAAHIHDMIMSLPAGYDTVITEGGNSISKGQKQLMTIARAMLMDSSMLILDEATSNVDTQTERLIQDAMLKLMQGRTCFVIAHRLSTITSADRILVMDKGCIVESGTHDELIRRNGVYAELYRAQFDQAA